MLNHWNEYVDEKIIKTNNDDTCYTMLEWLNGYIPQDCKYYDIIEIAKKCKYNEVEPSGECKKYIKGDELMKIHFKRIKEIAGIDYVNSFNYFNRNNLHHIIIPYIADFSDDPQNDNRELKYCIIGINKFFTEKHIIHVISDKPLNLALDNVEVMVLPRLDIANNTSVGRFADNTNRVKYAFENIDCEEAIIHWDDTYALSPFTYEDCKHSKYVKQNISKYKRGYVWGDGVCNSIDCIKHFGKECVKNYCSHVPFVFNKTNFLNMVNNFSHIEHPFNMDLAYFNIYTQDDEIFVPWIYSDKNPDSCIYKKEVKTKRDLEEGILNVKWSTIDIPLINFNHFEVLDSIYFKDKSNGNNVKVEKPNVSQTSFIKVIREDLKNGNLVKIKKPDGTYIWKRVKK
jgi:hypothetical protein